MAIGSAGVAAGIDKAASVTIQLKRFLSRYFYLCTSLVRSLSARSTVLFVAGYYLSVRLSEHAYGSLGVSSPFWFPGAFLLSSFLLTCPSDARERVC